MQSDPHLKSLADLLVGIAVRELRSANAGIKNAGPVTRSGESNITKNRSFGSGKYCTEGSPRGL